MDESTTTRRAPFSGPEGTPGVKVTVAVTDRPWDLEIDAIVVSAGGGFGQLAAAVAGQYPDAPWDVVVLSEITPDRPGVVALAGHGPRRPGPWLAVLATPHEETTGALTATSIATAASAAIRAAAQAGARSVAIPLLATGALGQDPKVVAAVEVPAATAAAAGSGVRNLVLVTVSEADVPVLRMALAGELPEPRGPLSDRREPPSVRLSGGVSTDWVDPSTGIPLVEDRLGVAPYISMLAAVISDRQTPTPLSIGVFGEWGSGKSYFMGLLRHRIDTLAASGSPGYCAEVVQIGFNAWHYADTNIWASLGDEIFRQLAGPDPSAEDRRRQLRAELAERLDQRREHEEITRQARTTAAELQAEVDAAAAARHSRVRDLVAALKDSPAFARRADALWRKLGVRGEAEQVRLLADELGGTLTETEALRRTPLDRAGKLAVAGAAVALLCWASAMAFAPTARAWLAPGGGVLAVAGALGLTALARVRSGLQALRSLAADLRTGLDRAARAEDRPAVTAALDALRQAEAEQRIAEAQLHDVVGHIGRLGRQLTALSPGQRLYRFLSERAGGDSYAGGLGLISVLRKDLEQLVDLMADWRAHPQQDDPARRPIDRIVLYIDDLDRCSPEQVVDVLQAVHLLLALDLFVVVIGVDPRWLLRSLSRRYTGILGDGRPAGHEADQGPATAEEYLEKIINIPVLLPGMSAGGLRPLLTALADTAAPTPGGVPGAGLGGGTSGASIPVETGSEAAAGADSATGRRPDAGAAAIPSRGLTQPELDILSALDLLIDTPRKAKRLFNLYRMLRSTRDLSGTSRFLGDDGTPGDYQAVAVLLGLVTADARLARRILDTPPEPAQGVAGGLMHRLPDTPWPQFVADLEVRESATRVAGTLAPESVAGWSRLHTGLVRASAEVTLPDLKAFRLWVPRIRRFSYVLGQTAGPPPRLR